MGLLCARDRCCCRYNQGQTEPGNSHILSPPHLSEFSVDEKYQEKIFPYIFLKTSAIRESTNASPSLLVGSWCTCTDGWELKAKSPSCLCKAHYCWTWRKQKSLDRLQRAQTRSFQMHITVQVHWFGSWWTVWRWRKTVKLFSLNLPRQIFPLADLSFLWAATQWWKQKKCTWGTNLPVLQTVPRQDTTRPKNATECLGKKKKRQVLDTTAPILMFFWSLYFFFCWAFLFSLKH